MSIDEFEEWRLLNNMDDFYRVINLRFGQHEIVFDDYSVEHLIEYLIYRHAYIPKDISLERFDVIMNYAYNHGYYIRS